MNRGDIKLAYDRAIAYDVPDVADRLVEMAERIEAIEAENQCLQQQLAEFKAGKDAEIERLTRSISTAAKLLDVEGPTDVIDLLAAAQLQITQLREALSGLLQDDGAIAFFAPMNVAKAYAALAAKEKS